MDFERHVDESEELVEFRREVRAWLEATPLRGSGDTRWTVKGTSREPHDVGLRDDLARRLGAKGWLFPTYPTEFGGGGMSWREHMVIETELNRYRLSLKQVHLGGGELVPAALLNHGSVEQKTRLLPGFLRGEYRYWTTMTEPHGGSDAANVKSTALLDGDEYVINGQKVMIGDGGDTDFLFTLLCTDPGGKRHQNLSWILVPADAPGVEIHKNRLLNGLKNTIYFDGVRVRRDNLVGSPNEGWQKVGATVMELEHGGGGLDIASNSFVEAIVDYCKQSHRGSKRLIDHDDVRELLSRILIDHHVLGLLGVRNFWHRFNHVPHAYGGAQLKYHTRVVKLETATRLRQIVGYSALVQNLDVDEVIDFDYLTRAGVGSWHGGGTGDTDRVTAARRLGLGRGEADSAPTTAPSES